MSIRGLAGFLSFEKMQYLASEHSFVRSASFGLLFAKGCALKTGERN